MPKYSILIPAYKSLFLKKAIDSVLAQTCGDFELIIVDDASPNDIKGIVTQYSDPRISYYRNEKNCGALNVVDNWNICLGYAKGEYVICIGDDDMMLPECLEQYNRLTAKYPDLDVYHVRLKWINEKDEFTDVQDARPEYESVYSIIWHKVHGRMQFLGDYMFRTKPLKEKGGFYKMPMGMSSDDISVTMAAREKGIANDNKFGFLYRMHSQNITRSGRDEDMIDGIRLAKQWYNGFLLTPTTDPDDEFMRQLSANEMNVYYKGVYMFLMRKAMNEDFRKAYKRWMRLVDQTDISKDDVKLEYQIRLKEYRKKKIKKIFGKGIYKLIYG